MTDIVQLAEYLLTAALIFTLIGLLCNLVIVSSRSRAATKTKTLVASGASETMSEEVQNSAQNPRSTGLALYATAFEVMAFLLVAIYVGIRIAVAGHGPFSNQHEFAVSFIVGILGAYLVFEYSYRVRVLSLVVLPVVAALILYAMSLPTEVQPLVPALQNNLLLTLHVGFAMLAYGAACVSFAAAVLYLAYPKLKFRKMPDRMLFDNIGYRAAVVTFPLLTIMILLGALWADTAWGRYWGWDPKETAALVTWLIYGAYLHARVTRGWQGKRSAWLLVLGFLAVLFAYFGNHFLGGLHSYG